MLVTVEVPEWDTWRLTTSEPGSETPVIAAKRTRTAKLITNRVDSIVHAAFMGETGGSMGEKPKQENTGERNMKPKDDSANKDHFSVTLRFGDLRGLLPIDPQGDADARSRSVPLAVANAVRSDG